MPDSSSSKIRQINERDAIAIALYLSEEAGMGDANCERMMTHWWSDNPAFHPSMPKGWVMESQQKIVGFLANIPTKFQFAGQPLVSFNPSTWFVSPEHRRTLQSRQLFHNFAEIADQTLSFICTPSEHVVRFYREEMCYFDFPAKAEVYHYYVNDYAQFLQLANSRKARLLHSPLLPWYRYQQRRRLTSLESHCDIETVSPIEDADSLQQLWELGREQHPHTHWRDAATIRWLMSGHRAERKVLYGCFVGSRLKAYGLFMRKREHGNDVLECLDLFSDDHQIEPFAAIIEHAIKQPSNQTCTYIKIPAFHPKVQAACTELGLPTQTLHNYYMVRYGNAFYDRLSPELSYLTGIHGDYALF